MNLKEFMQENILIFDGAMGTMLKQRGLKNGENTDIYGFNNPDILVDIHKLYLKAGANIITTNTFGSNKFNLEKLGYKIETIIDSAVKVAKKSINECDISIPRYVALDIGPLGVFIEPIGTLSQKEAYEIFKSQVIQGVKSGVDIIIIETMYDINEAKIAVEAAKKNSNLPIFVTMTFGKDGKTFLGDTPESMVSDLEKLEIDAIGINCSFGPSYVLPILKKIANISNIPIIVQANAGIPSTIEGKLIYSVAEKEYLNAVKNFIDAGATIIGGCCGTNPKYINLISKYIEELNKK